MKNIILTVTDIPKSVFFDIEVPTDQIFDQLKDDMIETLNGYDPNLRLKNTTTEFLCNRTGKQIQANETLETAGVWNGDYITILEV